MLRLVAISLLLTFSALAGPAMARERVPPAPDRASAAAKAQPAAPMMHLEDSVTAPAAPDQKSKTIGIVLFDDFETLDVFGPVQMWGRLPDHRIVMISQAGGPVRSAQGVTTNARYSFANAPQVDVLMVPGGMGTRVEVNNATMLDFLRRQNAGTRWTTSVCTGSALLAKAGILDGRSATTNKIAFQWVAGQSDKVAWKKQARWVVDGKYVTSSGVSAGTDMALALVETLYGRETAQEAARIAEYQWNRDPDNDPFAVE